MPGMGEWPNERVEACRGREVNIEAVPVEPRRESDRTCDMRECDRFSCDENSNAGHSARFITILPASGYKREMWRTPDPAGEFQVVVADTPTLREASFALRHEIYCRELGYEPLRANGLEQDVYDERARHYLLAHIPTGTWAGSVRIVLAKDTGQKLGLPFEEAPVSLLDNAPVDLTAIPRAELGEISRLTVAPEFRSRQQKHPVPQPSAGLYLALVAVAAAADNHLTAALCLMTPGLTKQMGDYGIHFLRLSETADYHGRRALFHIHPSTTCLDIRTDLQGILAAIQAQVAHPSTRLTRRR